MTAKYQRIGFTGRKTIDDNERQLLEELGDLIYKNGKTLVYIETPGAVEAVVDGYSRAGGSPECIESGLFTSADAYLVYANDAVMRQLDKAGIKDDPKGNCIIAEDLTQLLMVVEGSKQALALKQT